MATTTTPEAIESTVFESLKTFGAEPGAISRDAQLADIDIDSLDLAELAQIIEDAHGVELKGADVENVKTVGDVIDIVVARTS
ncbi:MAG: acyl carrier protein [Solirubrobacterales bacterium]|nr:acyl carrier protein [Solirubrobacterales bacterium]